MQNHYDYIILGAGLSGYTMALRMLEDAFFSNKNIALIDPDFNKPNNRTWCFWEEGDGYYESIVSYHWREILVKGNGLTEPMDISPYQYKKIEGADLYAFAKAKLTHQKNITFIEGSVQEITDHQDQVTVITTVGTYTSAKVLNSIYQPSILNTQKQAVVLQQHFLGWFVKIEKPAFNAEVATYMDFSIPQKGNCRFMYVLPTSQTEALLEYTLFSADLLPTEEYETAIKEYLGEIGVLNYSILRKEQGCIPMTTYDFTQHNTRNILHIGTAGGWTKASTGYTFTHTLAKSKKLISFLKTEKNFTSYSLKNRWTFYDAVLLEVLAKHNERGAEIFTRMFKEGEANHIFRFLDETSSFWDELKVIWSAPKVPFMKAAFKVLFK